MFLKKTKIKTGFFKPAPKTTALAIQYFLFFGVLGILLPFFNLYCYRLGFSGFQIGILSSMQTGAAVIFPLLWGALADRFDARKPIYVLCNTASAALWSLLLLTTGFYPMLVIVLFYSIFRAPVISFLEAFSMDILGSKKKSYGTVRAWGTISFIATVITVGRLTDTISIRIIVPLIFAGMLVQSLCSLALPSLKGRPREAGIAKIVRQKHVAVFLLCGFIMLVSHGAYYGFFSIHLENLGFDATFTGFAWALASVAEIVVMLFSRFIFSRFSLESVLLFSFFTASVRWVLVSFATSGLLIMFSQVLHAATYGAFHMASILYIDTYSPEGLKTVGQAINNSVSYGLGMMVGIFAAGYFYDRFGTAPLFGASAAVALAGAFILMAGIRKKPNPNKRP